MRWVCIVFIYWLNVNANVKLGNRGTNPNTAAAWVIFLLATALASDSGPPSRTMFPATLRKIGGVAQKHDKELKASIWHPVFLDPKPMEGLSHSLVPTPQATPEVLFQCLSRSEPNMIYGGCLHGLDMFGDVPRMLDRHLNTLGSLSCSTGHSWAVFAVCQCASSCWVNVGGVLLLWGCVLGLQWCLGGLCL